jgi:alginate O-acetyltransferase complex protein AlgI
MLFHLPSFLAFFLIFCGFFTLCPAQLKLRFVTFASLVFYAWWYPPSVVLMVAMVVGCWLMLKLVLHDRRWLAPCVVATLIPLVLYKYTDFILETLESLLGLDAPRLAWTLPLGLSFVSFTIVGYLVDTARQPEKELAGFWPTAVYITFFPHLIAGPILRARHILPQLPRMAINCKALMPNLALFIVGVLKKVLVADTVGAYVDKMYASHATLSAWEAVAAIFGFAIQIYCDFSAYSDMAIALAGMLGITFPENFRSPYTAASMSELWQRWHMTLSLWLRDYVFKPLHSSLYKYFRHLSIILTMGISGVWHGAAWTFVMWGFAHGLLLVIESITGYGAFAKSASGLKRWLCIFLSFVVWCLLAVMFRSPSLEVARDMIFGSFHRGGWGVWPDSATAPVLIGICALILHPFDRADTVRSWTARIPAPVLAPVLVILYVGCMTIASLQPANFYYFDF